MAFLQNIFENIIFPFPKLLKASKSINEKIERLNNSTQEDPYTYEYASNNLNIEDKVLLDALNDTIEKKKTLEDKAKSTLIAITISTTLIANILKFLQDINGKPVFVMILLLAIGFLSLLYMVVAGLLSLYCISEVNSVAVMYPEDFLLPEEEKKKQIAYNIEYNYLNNLKRNNLMATSYKCIIVSLLLLIVFFIISSVTIGLGFNSQDDIPVLKNELAIINNRISVLESEVYSDKQYIISIQKDIEDIIESDNITRENLINISETLSRINEIIKDEPNSIPEEIINLLLDLENQLGTQPVP
jgi:hypothetical protein